ncbi:MAG: PHP domain-containing protein, partial [Bacteroidota bacterium]
MYLNCHSYFSLRYGTLSPKRLVETAAAAGASVVCLTDINNTSCSFSFVEWCEAAGIKPVLGIEYRSDRQFLYIGLARNSNGWFHLNRFLTTHSLAQKPLPHIAPKLPDTFFIYSLDSPKLPDDLAEHEYIGIRPYEVTSLFSSDLKKQLSKLVILSPVTFLDDQGYKLHKVLQAIDQNSLITNLDQKPLAHPSAHWHSPEELFARYRSYPTIIRNTNLLLEQCSITIQKGLHQNRQSFTGSKSCDLALLTKLASEGCKRLYGNLEKARQRVHKELAIIEQQNFCCYFLITWDIVRYAQLCGFHYVGRGSGANSIVAYCLGITNVEPLELDLY